LFSMKQHDIHTNDTIIKFDVQSSVCHFIMRLLMLLLVVIQKRCFWGYLFVSLPPHSSVPRTYQTLC
jgi:hypothetical protein